MPHSQKSNSSAAPILEAATIACARAIRGRSARSMMLLGSECTGKIALLNEIQNIGKEQGLLATSLVISKPQTLAQELYPRMHEAMRSLAETATVAQSVDLNFRAGLSESSDSVHAHELDTDATEIRAEPGFADSADLQYNLPNLFVLLGRTAQAAGKGWLLLIKDVENLSREELAALITAIHRTNQECLPVLFVGAGLPEIARLAGDAKSYAERLFLYPSVGPLAPEDKALAVEKPIVDEGAKEVPIEKISNDLLVHPEASPAEDMGQWLESFYANTEPFPDDFLCDRQDSLPQERD